MGGKSLLFKRGKRRDFCMVVVSAAAATDNRILRKYLGVQRLRFATRDELHHHTGLTPGCVPPFGHPVFDLPLYVEAGLAAGDTIAFTAGDHRVSIVMQMADYLELAQPDGIFAFARSSNS